MCVCVCVCVCVCGVCVCVCSTEGGHVNDIAEAVQVKLDAYKADKRELGSVSNGLLYVIGSEKRGTSSKN